jgi:hypothetical protein
MARYRILGWQGIPAQLKVTDEQGGQVSLPLADWFMHEIDRRAMDEGLIGNAEYLELWAWSDEQEREGSAQEVAAAVAAELEAEWQPRRSEPK